MEDFTGATEVALWATAYEKASAVEGLLEVGSFVQFRARIEEDDKTGGKKVSANGMELIGGKRRRSAKAPAHYGIMLNTARHDAGDIALLKEVLLKYPGKVPVHLTLRNSLGNAVNLELGARYCVTPCPKLDEELSLYS